MDVEPRVEGSELGRRWHRKRTRMETVLSSKSAQFIALEKLGWNKCDLENRERFHETTLNKLVKGSIKDGKAETA